MRTAKSSGPPSVGSLIVGALIVCGAAALLSIVLWDRAQRREAAAFGRYILPVEDDPDFV